MNWKPSEMEKRRFMEMLDALLAGQPWEHPLGLRIAKRVDGQVDIINLCDCSPLLKAVMEKLRITGESLGVKVRLG